MSGELLTFLNFETDVDIIITFNKNWHEIEAFKSKCRL